MLTIGILALQGAFAEHEKILAKLDCAYIEIRQKKDLQVSLDGLILPGGESTVQGKLLRELDLLDSLKCEIENGLPVLGTCAGLILLAKRLASDENVHLGTLPVTVRRNAYGRQLGSFRIESDYAEIGKIPMTFIRAPYIEAAEKDVQITAELDGKIVGVRYKNQIGLSFHPELDENYSIHKQFLSMAESFSAFAPHA